MNRIASEGSRRDNRSRRRASRAIPGLFVLAIAWSSEPLSSRGLAQTPAKAQVAAAPKENTSADHRSTDKASPALPASSIVPTETEAIARARRTIADCQKTYQKIEDYTCTFYKRERVDGKLYTPHVITMKARTKPASLYFKFVQPNRGREAIFIHGKNNNKIVAHDVGIGRFVAGTMHLDPKGDMAMEENRHPVTEAGLGAMIDQVKSRWDSELHPGESVLLFHPQAKQALEIQDEQKQQGVQLGNEGDPMKITIKRPPAKD